MGFARGLGLIDLFKSGKIIIMVDLAGPFPPSHWGNRMLGVALCCVKGKRQILALGLKGKSARSLKEFLIYVRSEAQIPHEAWLLLSDREKAFSRILS